MSYATDKWFNYLRNDVLTEGVRDIGLPEVVIDRIESTLPDVSEKTKTWMGHQWKDTSANNLNHFTGMVRLTNREGVDPEGRAVSDFMVRLLNILTDYSSKGEPGWKELSPEEAEENAKKVRYVLTNLAGPEGIVAKKPFGAWKRGFDKALKNLSKLGVHSEIVGKVKTQLYALFTQTFEMFYRQYSDVFQLLNLDPTNFEYIKSDTIDEAGRTAVEYLEQREDPDQILHTFDDGSYWYDLQTSNCSIEAERMAHCGDADYNNTMISLRKKGKRQKHSKSYVTVEYGNHSDTIYQIKGRANSVPPEETWPHIAWLVDNLGVDSIAESGEHSSEYFDELLDYLRSHTNATIDGGFEARQEAMQEELDEILRAHDGNEGYDVWAEVYDEDIGEGQVYYSGGGSMSLQINLGWPAMKSVEGEYVPMDLEGNELSDIERIPTDNNWTAANDFLAEAGIKDWGYELPGEEEEFEYRVEMLEGHDPAWEMGDDDPPRTAHITIEVQTRQETSDDASAFDYFASEMEGHAEEISATQQKLRTKMVEEGFAVKNAFDAGRTEIGELEGELQNWQVYNEGGEIEFWFNPEVNDEGGRYTIIPSGVEFPVEVFYYTDPSFRDVRKQFQYVWPHARGSHAGMGKVNFSGDKLNQMMAQQLGAQDAMGQRAQQKGQTQLDFGPEYAWQPTPLELARDMEFIVIPQVNYFSDSQGISDVTISYRLTLRVDPNDNAEEIGKTINMVKYLNKNPEQVQEAAHEIIQFSVEPTLEKAETMKKDMLDGSLATTLIRAINRRYGQQAHDGNNEAEKVTLLASWAQKNWGDMTAVERTAVINTYLYPASQGALNLHILDLTDMDNLSHIDQLGMPAGWESDVREELRYRGAGQMVRNNYKWAGGAMAQDVEINEPEDLSEELAPWIETPERYEENQLGRVEKLLEKLRDPTHDLRIYNVRVGCNLIDRVGGTDAEIAAEIRGIDGVTTVRPIADSKREITPTETYVLFDIKFELVGSQSRVEYREAILIPQMRLIDGIKIINWSAIHKTNIQGTVRTVREAAQNLSEYGFGANTGASFGGVAKNLGSVRFNPSAARPTPTPTLDVIVQDWAEGGVQAYDFPTNTNDMRYHTMMPVSELWHHRSGYSRHPKDIFDVKYGHFNAVYQRLKDQLEDPKAYHEFIKDGAHGPVYVAIGKNGRVKITGNEDLVWFAKKAGLEELPVFLSYQRQV